MQALAAATTAQTTVDANSKAMLVPLTWLPPPGRPGQLRQHEVSDYLLAQICIVMARADKFQVLGFPCTSEVRVHSKLGDMSPYCR